MISNQTKQAFFKTDNAKAVRKLLVEMTKNPIYNTHIRGISDGPEEKRFVEKHMNYMCSFPKMNHTQYVSNLKLMTKITK